MTIPLFTSPPPNGNVLDLINQLVNQINAGGSAGGITALTGDVSAAGTGSVAATVASIGGKAVSLAGALTTSGAFGLTLTLTGTTALTLPVSGTLLVNDLSNIGTIAHALLFTDNTYDIGASGANRPKSMFLANTLTTLTLTVTGSGSVGGNLAITGSATAGATTTAYQAGATGNFQWNGRTKMFSPADGQVLLQNNGATGFTSLQFGGSTASFPELKRNATAINFRLADDSADAPITASTVGVTADNGLVFTNQTSDAGAQAATMTNAPTAGNPTFWHRISINGSNFAVPCWPA